MTGLKRHFCGSLFALLLLATCSFASNWTAGATDFAKVIAEATGPGVVTLQVTNTSSLSNADAADIQRTLETQLRAAGLRFGSPANAGSNVRVTLSENIQGYLWVAEITQGAQTKVEMVSLARSDTPVSAHSGPIVTIRKTLLWSEPTQILDAYVDGDHMIVLDANGVSSFALNSGRWQNEQSIGFTSVHPFPRDLRGLLVPQKNLQSDVYLPGTICNVSSASGMGISCRESDDPWPLGPSMALYNPARNYFTGALFPAGSKISGPFYSLVSVTGQNTALLISTGVDGRVHVSDGSSERILPPTITSDWGSDIAAVNSQCGRGKQLLVTSAGDDTVADSLRAFEFPDGDPVQVSAAADFPGPITAVWTHGDVATAVAHNLQTGSYEAYSVSVTCNQ